MELTDFAEPENRNVILDGDGKKKCSASSKGKIGRVFVEGRPVIVDTGSDIPVDNGGRKFMHPYSYTVKVARVEDGKMVEVNEPQWGAVVYVLMNRDDGGHWFRELRDAGSLTVVMEKMFPNGLSADDPRVKGRAPIKFQNFLRHLNATKSQSG